MLKFRANAIPTEAPPSVKGHLRLVYDGALRASHDDKADIAKSPNSSVSPFRSLPNGDMKDATELSTEQARQLLARYSSGKLTRNALYSALKKLWGEEIFESTRECHENMKQRCKGNYASLSPLFQDFPQFLLHMGPRPSKEYTLNRIDNRKGYAPDNCEWADKTTQSRNRRNTVLLTCDGETRPLVEWAEIKGISPRILRARKSRGWNDYDTIYGRAGEPDYQTSRDFSWPGTQDIWETKFRRIGGKSHEERHAFILKCGIEEMGRLNARFREDWQFDDLTEAQEAERNEYNRLYDTVQTNMKRAKHELLIRGRDDLIARCKDESLPIEKLFPKRKCNRFQTLDDFD